VTCHLATLRFFLPTMSGSTGSRVGGVAVHAPGQGQEQTLEARVAMLERRAEEQATLVEKLREAVARNKSPASAAGTPTAQPPPGRRRRNRKRGRRGKGLSAANRTSATESKAGDAYNEVDDPQDENEQEEVTQESEDPLCGCGDFYGNCRQCGDDQDDGEDENAYSHRRRRFEEQDDEPSDGESGNSESEDTVPRQHSYSCQCGECPE